MREYVYSMIPQTGGILHTEEMAIDIKGQYNWLWNVMDRETRFLLTSQISQRREIKDARKIFQKAKKVANGKPQVMVTDGLPSYIKAFQKGFFTLKNPRVKHIAKPRFVDKANNNMVERMQSSLREREKVMKGFKAKEQTPAIDGWRIYHNFIRPHQALDWLTPAEKSNLNLNHGENKWLSLIKQSAKNGEIPKVTTEKNLTIKYQVTRIQKEGIKKCFAINVNRRRRASAATSGAYVERAPTSPR